MALVRKVVAILVVFVALLMLALSWSIRELADDPDVVPDRTFAMWGLVAVGGVLLYRLRFSSRSH